MPLAHVPSFCAVFYYAENDRLVSEVCFPERIGETTFYLQNANTAKSRFTEQLVLFPESEVLYAYSDHSSNLNRTFRSSPRDQKVVKRIHYQRLKL